MTPLPLPLTVHVDFIVQIPAFEGGAAAVAAIHFIDVPSGKVLGCLQIPAFPEAVVKARGEADGHVPSAGFLEKIVQQLSAAHCRRAIQGFQLEKINALRAFLAGRIRIPFFFGAIAWQTFILPLS